MAYGLCCKHCGHQESPHQNPSCLSEEEASVRVVGSRVTILRCAGFEYHKKDYPSLVEEYRADRSSQIVLPEEAQKLLAKLDKEDGLEQDLRDAYEQQGRSRAAFGWYAHHCYQRQITTDVAKLDGAIDHATNRKQREIAQQAKSKYMADAQNGGCLYIG